MAKQRSIAREIEKVDRTLLVTLIFMGTGYLLRDQWSGILAGTAAFMMGTVWSVRVIQTNRSRTFRLTAALVLLLTGLLLAVHLARSAGIMQ